MPYEIELACDAHEGPQFVQWLTEQGHAAKIGRTTGNTLTGIDDPEEAELELRNLWDRYCAAGTHRTAPMSEMQTTIDAIAENYQIGKASAVKRGRNPAWPHIALIIDYCGHPGVTHNPMGRRAYATREEAIAAAERHIAAFRAQLRADLVNPRMRALREQHGLPREIA